MSPVLTAEPNGVPIAYRRSAGRAPARGGGVPVLFLHGMGGDGRTWDAVARTVRGTGRDVVTVDLRGHGRSGRSSSYLFDEFAQDVIGVCEHAGLDRVDLVGHSLGALTSTLVAQRRPDLVRRLVLEEMPMPLRAHDPVPEVPAHRPTPAEMWHALGSMLRSPRGVLAFDRALTDPALRQFRSPRGEWWAALPRMTAPVLFLRGTRPGSMVDPRLLAEMRHALPGMTVHRVPCGHSIHRDRRARFEAAVVPFLAAGASAPNGATAGRSTWQE